MNLLYMDETYSNKSLPKSAQFTALTAMLLPSDRHAEVRARYYAAVAMAVEASNGVIPPVVEIHAAELLPGCADEIKFSFLAQIASIVSEMNLKVYRIGYFNTEDIISMCKNEKGVLGLAFSSLLEIIKPELIINQIWPVMETDWSKDQDKAFAGQVQWSDHIESRIGPGFLTRDVANLGEVLYSTKRSVHGSIVDCVGYLLNARSLSGLGVSLTPFKERLAEISEGLLPSVRFNEIIAMSFKAPPAGYIPEGPFRYAFSIVPSDK